MQPSVAKNKKDFITLCNKCNSRYYVYYQLNGKIYWYSSFLENYD